MSTGSRLGPGGINAACKNLESSILSKGCFSAFVQTSLKWKSLFFKKIREINRKKTQRNTESISRNFFKM